MEAQLAAEVAFIGGSGIVAIVPDRVQDSGE
jgi:hypothetical protein